ncbi:MAG: PilZ domain-containing protein [Desulfobacterales bacterium]|jgi:hypothetical protein
MISSGKRLPGFAPGAKTRENRRHERRPCSESTCFSANRQLHEGVLMNTSAGGTYIQARGKFKINQQVIVAGITATDGREIKRFGRIVRVEPSGIAICFTDGHQGP